jgi:pSer/pThr/pTyr-binding forkhead associated (FHA) protein
MRRDRERLDPAKPSLIVTYGNTTRKIRPLDRDVIMLGQLPGCDVPLKSPDVAPVHALIIKVAGGWRVRDCTGRAATRLNGKAVQDEPLNDSDTIQIGAFSFTMHLPGVPLDAAVVRLANLATSEDILDSPASIPDPSASDVYHLRRSRRHLARLALSLRQKCQQGQITHTDVKAHLDKRKLDLEQQEKKIRHWAHELDTRVAQVEKGEEELNNRRQVLEQEAADWHETREQAENELAKRQAEMDAFMQLRYRESQQQRFPVEPGVPTDTGEAIVLPGAGVDSDTLRQLHVRRQELDCYARYLQRLRERLQAEQAEGVRQAAPSQPEPVAVESVEQAAMREERERLVQTELAQQREQRLLAENLLRQQQAEIVRLKEELQAAPPPPSQVVDVEAAAINQQLRKNLSTAQQQLCHASQLLQQERARMQERTRALEEDVDALRQELTDRNAVIDSLRLEQLTGPDVDENHPGYHTGMERDRQKLAEQLNQLDLHRAEMEEKAREAELQMARERAQIARERVELNRQREEVRQEKDKVQREASTRERQTAVEQQEPQAVGVTQSPKRRTGTHRRTADKQVAGDTKFDP